MAKKKTTLVGTSSDWARQFDDWEKDRNQRVEMSKKMDAEGDMRPLANRVMATNTNEKFNAKKGSLDGGSTKWRTEAVKDLPSKKYGRKYGDRLTKLMDEAGVPQQERFQFARWMDSQEHQSQNPDQYPKAQQPKKNSADFGTKKARPIPEYSPVGTAKKNESALDKLLGGAKKAGGEVGRFMNNVNNMATFGLMEGIEKKNADEIAKRTGDDTLLKIYEQRYGNEDRGTAGKIADFASKGVGMMATGGGIAKGLQALGLGTKAGAGLGANAVRMAGQGAVAGGGDQAIRSILDQTINKDLERNENRTWADEGKDIAMGTAFGAVLDPLLTVGPQAIREGARSLRGVADDAVQGNDLIRQLTEMSSNSRATNTNAMDALEALRGAKPDANSTLMQALDPNYNVKLPNSPETISQSPLRQQLDQIDAEIANNPTDFSLVNKREEILTEMQFEQLMNQTVGGNRQAVDAPVVPEASTTTAPPRADISAIDKEIAKIDKQLAKKPLDMNLRNKRMQLEAQKQMDSALNQSPIEAPQTNRDAQLPVEQNFDASDSVPNAGNTDALGALRGPRPTQEITPTSPEPLPTFIDNSTPVPRNAKPSTATQMSKSWVNDTAGVEKIDKQVRQLDSAEGIIDYNKPRSLMQKMLGREGSVKDANVKVDSSLGKSMQVYGKNAHSQASTKTESQWSKFAQELEKDDVVPQELWDYASAMHGKTLLTKQQGKNNALLDALDELETNTNLTDAETAELQDIVKSYKDYTLPEGMTEDVLDNMINTYGSNPKIQKYYKDFQELQKQKLHRLYEGGLINEKAYDAMLENETYISMARNFGDEAVTGLGGGRQARNPIMGMKRGSDAKIKNPFTEAIRQTYVTEFNIQKNKALKPIEKYAEIQGSGFRKVAKNEDLRGLHTVQVFKDGNPVTYEVPAEVETYVKNMATLADDPDALTGMIEKIANVQRKLTTQYSPAFQLKSLLREPVQSALVSRTNNGVLDGLKNTAVGYVDALAGPKLEQLTSNLPKPLQFKSYKETWKGLGGNQFQYIDVADEHLKKASKELMETGKINGSSKIKPLDWLGSFGELIERGPRLGEFRSAKGQGYSDVDALYEAIDLTNYKRGGTTARKANKYVPYLNATIQGNDRVIRAFKEAPIKTTARGVGALTSVATVAYMTRFMDGVSEEQRNELRNLQDFQKSAYTYIPNFWDENDDSIYAIPKPFAVGNMFMNPAERFLDDYYNEVAVDTNAKEQVAKAMGDIVKAYMPPMGPALVGPVVEATANHQFFSGMPIEQNTDIPKEEREAYGQSVITKMMADSINGLSQITGGIVSPADIDHVVKQSVGTLGTSAIGMTDKMLGENAPVAKQGDPILNPLGQFKLDPTTSGRGYKDIEKLKKGEDISSIIQGITGDPTDTTVRNLNDEQRAEFDGQSNYYNMFKQYSDMNKEINEIRKDSSLSGDAKRRQIEYLRKEQDEIYSQSVDYFNRLNNN